MDISLLIVDDEQETRDGLLWYISQMDIDFSKIQTASDGIAALKHTREFMPNILLCDIRMPNMDGLELATTLLSKNPEMRVIFISGYADKEYLKYAITLQADGYIEKPIILDELSSILKRSVNILVNSLQKKAEYERISEVAVVYAKQQIFQALLQSPYKLASVRNKFALHFDNIPEVGAFATIVFHIKWVETVHSNKRELDLQQMQRIIEHKLSVATSDGLCNAYFSGKLSSTRIGAVVQIHYNRLLDFCSKLENIGLQLQHQFKSVDSICLAIGDKVNRLNEVSESYTKACSAVEWLLFSESSKQIICCNEACPINPKDLSKQLSEKLKQLNFYAAKQLIIKQTQEISAYELSEVKKVRGYYSKLLYICMDFENLFQGHTYNEMYRRGMISVFLQLHTLNEVSRFVLSRIEKMYPNMTLPTDISPKIRAAIEYIWDNIGDPSLSVGTISESLGFTENYLCTLFKSEVGNTLNKTILSQRIELAKRLLISNFKLYEVSSMVGFSDPNYFSTVFKKQVGSTPTDFRRSIQNNSGDLS